jgi:hypothetical protein
MTKLLACLLFAAAVVAANPFVETYLSEVGVDSAHQFVELLPAPDRPSVDLFGWQIVTSTSACTLCCYLRDFDPPLLVDSAALAGGEVGYGTIRLNPPGDSVKVINDSGEVVDIVHFPRSPTGPGSAPLPPSTGSVAFWNYDDAQNQSMNWYVDSTPTPGVYNDDYSGIAGSVTGTGGITLDEAYLTASGQSGHSHCSLYQQRGYGIRGLGAGKYEVNAYAYYQGQPYEATYPESVSVGYSQTTGNINFVFPVTGVVESPSVPLLPLARVSGRALLLYGDGISPVSVQLYNQVGSRVSEFHLGPINGEKRIELPATLAPGVYFALKKRGADRSTVKVVLW